MGSLLKEYMNASQQQDEVQSVSENGDKVTSTAEEKDNSLDNVQDPEGSSCQSTSHVAEPTGKSSHELEDAKTVSECLEDDSAQEPNGQVQNNISSESANPSMQCFKNVVAIVDPPRGGLHPTVSDTTVATWMVSAV